jgi:hypothetical protein
MGDKYKLNSVALDFSREIQDTSNLGAMSDTHLHNAAGVATVTFWLETRTTNSGTLSKYECHILFYHLMLTFRKTLLQKFNNVKSLSQIHFREHRLIEYSSTS